MEITAKAGDRIRIRLAREELECVLLESYDKSVVLVKLDSGYNIGIPKEHVLGFEIIEKFKGSEKVKKEVSHSKGKKNIVLVVTGGTIASRLDTRTGGVKPTTASDLLELYPELSEMANVNVVNPFMKLSENMNSDDWIELAKVVESEVNKKDVSGVVIAHGTDTLHYSSSALSFFLRELNKPVVFTYAQRSIDRPSSDALLNLKCAFNFALSECAEVVVVGHSGIDDDYCYALRGTRVRKLHTSKRDAFKSVNSEPIAKVFGDKIEFLDKFNARRDDVCKVDAVFNDKIAVVKFYPGQEPEILEYYLKNGYKGVIIEVLGIGNLPGKDASKSWVPTLKKVVKEGMVVCAVAQTVFGRLHPFVYSAGREIAETGVIYLEDMLSETGFVKLGWVLGHRSWKDKVREKMLESFADEISLSQ